MSKSTVVMAIQESRAAEAVQAIEAARRRTAEVQIDDLRTHMIRPSGVAVFPIRGIVYKGLHWPGWVVDPERVLAGLHDAASNDDVSAIAMQIDSPGGGVAGVQDLGDAIHAVAQEKRLVAHIDDLGASAAYWIGSQASTLSVNRSGMVGSIGVYAVVADMSEWAEKEGIKVHVVTTGRYKGGFVPGAEVPDHHLEDLQREVDGYFGLFLEAIERGRGAKGLRGQALKDLADGRVWMGREAQSRGLVDHVASFEEVVSALEEGATKSDSAARARRMRMRARAEAE